MRILAELGGDHCLVAHTRVIDIPAQHQLRIAIGVHVSSVEEIAASFGIGVKDLARCGIICAPALIIAKRHRAQRQTADFKTGVS